MFLAIIYGLTPFLDGNGVFEVGVVVECWRAHYFALNLNAVVKTMPPLSMMLPWVGMLYYVIVSFIAYSYQPLRDHVARDVCFLLPPSGRKIPKPLPLIQNSQISLCTCTPYWWVSLIQRDKRLPLVSRSSGVFTLIDDVIGPFSHFKPIQTSSKIGTLKATRTQPWTSWRIASINTSTTEF